ncbi:uncharacterized protein [Hyperolius riggenbachi]|uniref:uncharacterized protein n=1 Tax=Hyperolius riggenbachi TaxID=752182 RepID=UPI0035A3904D
MSKKREEHKLTKSLIIIDNRGFRKMMPQEIAEACAQIRSLRDIGKVDWDKDNLEETIRQFPLKYQTYQTEQHPHFILPVLVYSGAQTWNANDAECMEKLITNAYRITGIHPVIVITNRDNRNHNSILERFGELGAMRRLCIQNYTENNHQRTDERDQQILEFLDVCIREARRGINMQEGEDPQTRFVSQASEQIKLESDQLREQFRQENDKLKGAIKKDGCSVS